MAQSCQFEKFPIWRFHRTERQTYPIRLACRLDPVSGSIAFVFSPRNKPIVLNTIMTRLKITDPAQAEEGYQDVLRSLEKHPRPALEGMRNIHRLLRTRNPSVDKVKPEQLIDDRIMRKLDESGFISRLHSAYGVR